MAAGPWAALRGGHDELVGLVGQLWWGAATLVSGLLHARLDHRRSARGGDGRLRTAMYQVVARG